MKSHWNTFLRPGIGVQFGLDSVSRWSWNSRADWPPDSVAEVFFVLNILAIRYRSPAREQKTHQKRKRNFLAKFWTFSTNGIFIHFAFAEAESRLGGAKRGWEGDWSGWRNSPTSIRKPDFKQFFIFNFFASPCAVNYAIMHYEFRHLAAMHLFQRSTKCHRADTFAPDYLKYQISTFYKENFTSTKSRKRAKIDFL